MEGPGAGFYLILGKSSSRSYPLPPPGLPSEIIRAQARQPSWDSLTREPNREGFGPES